MARAAELDRLSRPPPRTHAASPASSPPRSESPVLDLVFVLAVVALFALVGIVAKAVERL